MDEKPKIVEISVVIPVYCEEGNVKELYAKLRSVLSPITENYELIFVDDGSTDNSFNILKEINKEDQKMKAIKLRRNFGKSIALNAAFRYTKGDVVITMDGDLQDDPVEIPRFIEKIEEGYDLVVGWKYPRNDPFTKTIPSKIFNWLTCMLTGVNLHDFNCGFKAYKKEVIENISLYGEMHRYIPALAAWAGFKITEIKVKHHPRKYGKSKYNASRLLKGFLDLITVEFLVHFATRPMHVFGVMGFIFLILGFLSGIYVVYLKYMQGVSLSKYPTLQITLLIITGIQLISLGLIAEMFVRKEIEHAGAEDINKKYVEKIIK